MAEHIPDNPYLAARQEWTERYGSYVRAASAWRLVGIVSLSLATLSTGYALYQSTEVKLVPYIVEVDKLGTAVTAGTPQQIEYADPRVVRATPARVFDREALNAVRRWRFEPVDAPVTTRRTIGFSPG